MYIKIPERTYRKKDPVRFQMRGEEVYCLRQAISITSGASKKGPPGYECVRILPNKGKGKNTHKIFTTYDTKFHPIDTLKQPPLMRKIVQELIRLETMKENPDTPIVVDNKDPLEDILRNEQWRPGEQIPDGSIGSIDINKPVFDTLFSFLREHRRPPAASASACPRANH